MRFPNCVFIFLLIFPACQYSGKEQPKIGSKNTISVSNLKLQTLDNSAIPLSDFKDKAVFVNFWATWCKPCIQEMPSIEQASILLKDQPVLFLLASDQDIEEINAFRKQHPFNLTFVQSLNNELLQPAILPTTYIFNAEGELVFTESGFRQWNNQESIDLLLQIAGNND